jgi:hypothetical protein
VLGNRSPYHYTTWLRERVREVGSVPSIEEGRAASKSPRYTFGYFLSTSKQEVSADVIRNSAVGNFSPKTEGTKTKAARCLFLVMPFPFLYILKCLQSSLTVYILPSLSAC